MGLLLDMLSTAAMLFVVASGLMLVFGVMKIVNFAHAATITLGGYAALVAAKLGLSPWAALPIAFAVGMAFGMLVERLMLRRLYRRPLDAILATWGLGLVLGQVIILLFGRGVQFVDPPVQGAFNLWGTDYSLWRLLLIVAALLLYLALTLLLDFSRFGVRTRAVIVNEELARGLGIPTERIRLLTFGLGAGLGALAGALITPLFSLEPNLGLPWLVSAFMLVMVAGNKMGALLLTCLLFGGVQVLVSFYISPILGSVSIALLAALTLRLLPRGLIYD